MTDDRRFIPLGELAHLPHLQEGLSKAGKVALLAA